MIIEGGEGPDPRTLTRAVALPGEVNDPIIVETPEPGEEDLDRLNVFSDTVTNGMQGTLTADTISGLGMGAGLDLLEVDYEDGITPTAFFPRGIKYTNLHVVEVLLGKGNDNFTITSTAEQTLTVVHGGGGSDTLTVTDSTGPVVLFGDTSADGERYSSTLSAVNGSGYGFTNPGSDFIDASGAKGIVVIDGGAGNDELYGADGAASTSFMAGGAGDDEIFGGDLGKNWIIGDSAFDVDYRDRTVIIDDDGIDAQGVAEAAGADIITGGTSGDVIIGDHGIITQAASVDGSHLIVVPGTLDMMLNRPVLKVESSNQGSGGNDIIDAKDGPNIVFGGFGADTIESTGGQDVVVGDNGTAEFENGLPTIVASTHPEFGGADKITSAGGRNILVGGSAGDTIKVLGGSASDIGDVILGDNGKILFDAAGNVISIESTDPEYYGDDVIQTGAGDNIVIAGSGNDTVTSQNGDDVILGDNGKATFENNILCWIASTFANFAPANGGAVAYNDMIDAGSGRERRVRWKWRRRDHRRRRRKRNPRRQWPGDLRRGRNSRLGLDLRFCLRRRRHHHYRGRRPCPDGRLLRRRDHCRRRQSRHPRRQRHRALPGWPPCRRQERLDRA